MEYNSYTQTLLVSCDEYSSLVVRHLNCSVACNLPLDGTVCPCVLSDSVLEAEENCLYNGVTNHHASREVLEERAWCRDRRQERSLRYSDLVSDMPVCVVFTD